MSPDATDAIGVGPGEVELDLARSSTTLAGPGAVETLVRDTVARAHSRPFDRVLTFVTADQAAAADLAGIGFRRLPWRDRSAAHLAYALDLAPVVIRPAEPVELDRAGELTLAGYVADGLVDPTHTYAQHLTDAADRATSATLLVAVDPAGSVVGTVTFCRPGSAYAELSRPGEAEFRMLAVDPSARGLRVGAALVQACLDHAGAAGDQRLVLSTRARMHAAGRLYSRLGFVADPARNWSPEPGIDLLAYQRDVVLGAAAGRS